MNDLPVFLQMFIRLFAVLALGAWLQTLATKKEDEPRDGSRGPAGKPQVHAPADPAAPPDPAPAPAARK